MSSFESRVENVMFPHLRDADNYMMFSPCMLKSMLIELASTVYRENQVITDIIATVVGTHALPAEPFLSTLRAIPGLFGLCSQYVFGVTCHLTVFEVIQSGVKEDLVRGGLQQVFQSGLATRLLGYISSATASTTW